MAFVGGIQPIDFIEPIQFIGTEGGPTPGTDGQLDFGNPDQSGLWALMEDI